MNTAAENTLALHGGPAVVPAGPPRWPIADEDLRKVLMEACADGTWGQYEGPHVARLTQTLAEMHGVPHAWCCSSGNVAIELALRGLRVGEGDEVILAGYDFPGNFRSIEAVGARPVLVDVEPGNWCLDHRQLASAHSANVRAVIVSHLHGGLASMPEILAWAHAHDLAVIEDACQVPGGTVGGRPAGAWGDVGVLSFGGSKLLTAGRGGVLLTERPEVLQRIKVFCERGSNAYPLSELQAAVLGPQLEKLADRNRRRYASVIRLQDLCRPLDCLRPVQLDAASGIPAFYKLAWAYDAAKCGGCPRDQFVAAVRAEGVALDEGFRGFLRRGTRRCRRSGELPHSRVAVEQTVILHHPVLLGHPREIDAVARAIGKVVQYFSGQGQGLG
jgi:dTDP-4-amino-4,6-dideoxygalactose transaminase